MQVGKHLVAADIERPEGDGPAVGFLEHAGIELGLRGNIRIVGAEHERDLGPVEPDPLGARLVQTHRVGQQACIQEQRHRHAVARLRRHVAQALIHLEPGALRGHGHLEVGAHLVTRAQVDDAVVAVDEDHVSRLDPRQDPLHPSHQRHVERPRDDRGVGVRRSFLEQHGPQAARLVVQQLGRAERARHQHRVFGHHHSVGRSAVDELAEQTIGQLLEIEQAFAQIAVGDMPHTNAGLVLDPLNGRFRRQAGAYGFVDPA